MITEPMCQTYLAEDFSSGQMPPAGWSIDDINSQWTVSNTAVAGGVSPEAKFQWIQQVGVTKLISPLIDLTGLTTIYFQMNHMYDDYDGDGPSIGIATRSGDGLWNSVWGMLPTANVGPELIEIEISNADVGQPDFQICCYILGNLFNLDYWYLDEIKLFSLLELNIKVLLEGPYSNGEMTNLLNSSENLPLNQPYTSPPWNYHGIENVIIIPNSNIVDWILVDIMKKELTNPIKYISVAKQAGFLLKNGRIKATDGISNLTFHLSDTDSLHVWIHHRNHLSVMSSNILEPQSGICHVDFTSDSQVAVEGNQSMKELELGTWGILSGDGNANGQINNPDKSKTWLEQNNNSGYLAGDYNLDGNADEKDIDSFWSSNAGKGHWLPDTTKIPFLCGDQIQDNRDGQLYQTVLIGEQCWMEENLNYETGTSWCYYNSSYYCDVYGRLYDWPTIMNGAPGSNAVPSGIQGICPEGWHLPSDGEWCILTQHIDPTIDCDTTGYNGTDAGTKMKSTWGWSSGGNGTNSSGFNALPGGSMGIYHFDDLYLFAYFWTTSEDYPGYAWLFKLNYGLPTIGRYFSQKNRGYSVRCVKDE